METRMALHDPMAVATCGGLHPMHGAFSQAILVQFRRRAGRYPLGPFFARLT